MIDLTDIEAARLIAIADSPRAGLWRRCLALLIDVIVVMFPFQILAAILFAITAGTVQMDSGFYRYCEPVETLPQPLDNPPPHDSNFANICHASFLGAPTSAVLIVGRATRDGSLTTTVTQSYMLDKAGKPIRGLSLDWLIWPALLAYLIVMVRRTGKTLGAKVLKIKLVDASAPDRSGVPVKRAIIRYLAMAIGLVPLWAVFFYQYIATRGNADAMFSGSSLQWLISTGAIAVFWTVVLICQVALKRDPIYDRLAGTAVLKD